jgi:hypothetical protein
MAKKDAVTEDAPEVLPTLDEGKQLLADRPDVASVVTDKGVLHQSGLLVPQ